MNKKVLICDDEPYILESVSYIARQADIDFITAEDGQQSLDLAIKDRPPVRMTVPCFLTAPT